MNETVQVEKIKYSKGRIITCNVIVGEQNFDVNFNESTKVYDINSDSPIQSTEVVDEKNTISNSSSLENPQTSTSTEVEKKSTSNAAEKKSTSNAAEKKSTSTTAEKKSTSNAPEGFIKASEEAARILKEKK